MQTIYTDITVLIDLPILTGIQRVTIEILSRFITNYSDSLNVILLHYNQKKNYYTTISKNDFFDKYVYKNKKSKIKLNYKPILISDMESGSIFLDLDSAWMSTVKRSWLLPQIKERGLIIISHIYDLIPIYYPQFCHEQTTFNFMDYITSHLLYADYFIANANSTLNDIFNLADKLSLQKPRGYVVPLGADFVRVNEYKLDDISPAIQQATAEKYVLMVGTIEPRKNHKLLLEAFDNYLLDSNVNIIFAGRPGWHMDLFIDMIKKHPQYNKRLFWFSNANDIEIDYLYKNAFYVAFLSYIEGFGLPIIEALQHQAPVIATCEKVNVEIGLDNCKYIPQDDAKALSNVIISSIENPSERIKLINKISNYHPATWDHSAECFFNLIKQIQDDQQQTQMVSLRS